MTRRRPTPEELALWRKVAKTADRVFPRRQDKNEDPTATRPAPKTPAAEPLKPFEIGGARSTDPPKHNLLPGLPERLADAPVNMDRKAYTRLRRGKLSPEARIDLHGMTLAQAQPALTGFILRSHAQGRRLVLVITGKGKRADDDGPIPVRHGALRHSVPQWLSSPPLAQVVLQVSAAHQRHGGDGAYYVYLRRSR